MMSNRASFAARLGKRALKCSQAYAAASSWQLMHKVVVSEGRARVKKSVGSASGSFAICTMSAEDAALLLVGAPRCKGNADSLSEDVVCNRECG